MVDPHYRSVSGFEALVQKEWVALGHPFTLRHRLTIDALLSGEDEAPEVRQAGPCGESSMLSLTRHLLAYTCIGICVCRSKC